MVFYHLGRETANPVPAGPSALESAYEALSTMVGPEYRRLFSMFAKCSQARYIPWAFA